MPGWIWQKQIDGLSKKYRVIAVDPRSQGESDKPTYGHLPETRARDYKQVVDPSGMSLAEPVTVASGSINLACLLAGGCPQVTAQLIIHLTAAAHRP
jgi:pimeloyl-ACP methyl ester carboxylesterase